MNQHTRARQVVVAPISGVVRDLEQVPDPVFAEQMVGPGVAIAPDPGHPMPVLAPVTGVLVKAHPHAVVVAVPKAGDEAGVMVHLGLDTVGLEGAGFTLHTAAGAQVHRGTHLIDWDPGPAVSAGLALISPIIVLGARPGDLRLLATAGSRVRAGQALLAWSGPAV